jgi:hypothetical protein
VIRQDPRSTGFDHSSKFPGTVPSVFILNYLQAHHLDLEF